MPLFDLLNSPGGGGRNLNEWAFSHAQDHLEIIQAIQAKKSVALPFYQIDPLNEHDLNQWLNRHQQMHDDFNSVMLINGVDLQNVDFSDKKERSSWTLLNFQEHRDVRDALAI